MDYVLLSLAGRNVVSQNSTTATADGATSSGATADVDNPSRVCSVFTLSEGAGPSTASDYKSGKKSDRRKRFKKNSRTNSKSKHGSKNTSVKQVYVPPTRPATPPGGVMGSSPRSAVPSTHTDRQEASAGPNSSASYIADSLPSPDASMATLTYSYSDNPFVCINDTSTPVNQSLNSPILLQEMYPRHSGECETNIDDECVTMTFETADFEFSRMAKSRSQTPDRSNNQ
jgi:hypothetical protein